MNYSITRHYQRYEFLINSYDIEGLSVIDIGCGTAVGASMLTEKCGRVVGIDPILKSVIGKPFVHISPTHIKCKLELGYAALENVTDKFDVCVAVEVIEHQQDPMKFLKKTSEVGNYAFLTTPLAETTGKTRNPDHVVEYNEHDLRNMLTKFYDIIDVNFQMGDMTISKQGKYNGDSMDTNHVVQMYWLGRK